MSGHARFAGPHAVAVKPPNGADIRTLTADFFVIATGSRPNRPDDVPFDGETVFDSETILQLPRMPKTMTVLGAGVVGHRVREHLRRPRHRGHARGHARPAAALPRPGDRGRARRGARPKLGVTIVHSERYARVERTPGKPPRVACETQAGRRLESDVLLYCVGRDGNTSDIGLGTLGLKPGKYGLLEVNENYQTVHPHIYAVGDVIGYPALASTSMEQGRQAMRHALGIPGPKGRTEVLPFAVYSIPEVAYIGETEESLVAEGVDYVAGRGNYDKNPRGQILGESGGMLKLVFERPSLKLVGAHVVGSAASEIIHVGQAFLRSGATATDIAETLYNYPTLSDMYRHAALKALAEDRSKG